MPVIDLDFNASKNSAEGKGTFNRFGVKRDGRDASAFVYDLSIVFMIASVDEARIVAGLFPGAAEDYVRATERDNWKRQSRITPEITGALASLFNAETGESLIEGGAEVKAVVLRASKRAVAMTVQLQMAGQTAAMASKLAYDLANVVSLKVTGSQQVLPLFGDKPKPVLVSMGGIAVGTDAEGDTVWGRVVDQDLETGRCKLDTFEDEVFVEHDTVSACWPLLPGDVTEKALKKFVTACKKSKAAPSYRAITLAVGESYAAHQPAEGEFILSREIVARAVEFAKDPEGAGVLPPEADETDPGNVVDFGSVKVAQA